MNRTLNSIIVFLILALLPACGGGGGGEAPGANPEAVVTLTISDSLGVDRVGAVDLMLELPRGFTLDATGSELQDGVVTSSVTDSYIDSAYQPETPVSNGRMQLVFLSGNRQGLFGGPLLSIRRTLLAGESLPSAAAFNVTGLKVSDLQGNDTTLSGSYSVSVSVSQQ